MLTRGKMSERRQANLWVGAMTHEPILLVQTESIDPSAQAIQGRAPLSRPLALPHNPGEQNRHAPTIDVVLRLSKHATADEARPAGLESIASVEPINRTPVINVRVHELALHTIQRMTS